MERVVSPPESERSVWAIPVSPRSVSTPSAISQCQGESGAVSEVRIAVEQIPTVRSRSIRGAVEAVEIAGIAVGAMIVPVVLVVYLFLHVAVFVVAANKDIAFISIVGNHLVQVPVRAFHDGQLGVTPGQTQSGNQQEGHHRQAAGGPSNKAIRF